MRFKYLYPSLIILAVLASVLLYSYLRSNRTYSSIVEKSYGQKLSIPDDLLRVSGDLDSCNFDGERIVVFINGKECALCYIRVFAVWNYVNDLAKRSHAQLMFIFDPDEEDAPSLIPYLRLVKEFNIFLDVDHRVVMQNDFLMMDSKYDVFLIDKDNKVVLRGNPTLGDAMLHLYEEILSNSNGLYYEKEISFNLERNDSCTCWSVWTEIRYVFNRHRCFVC